MGGVSLSDPLIILPNLELIPVIAMLALLPLRAHLHSYSPRGMFYRARYSDTRHLREETPHPPHYGWSPCSPSRHHRHMLRLLPL